MHRHIKTIPLAHDYMSLCSHFSRQGKKTCVNCTVSRRNVNALTTALHTIVARLSHLALSQKNSTGTKQCR